MTGPTSGDLKSNGKLDPGEAWSLHLYHHAWPATTTNTATLTSPTRWVGRGRLRYGHSEGGRSQIAVTKAPDKTVVCAGWAVVYTYTVKSTGDTPGGGEPGGRPLCPGWVREWDTNGNHILETSETWTYTCTAQLPATTTQWVRASGQPSDAAGAALPGIAPVNAQANATVTVVNPGIHLAKSGQSTVVHTSGL